METTIDLNAIKSKQQTAWSSGDYAVIGTTLQIVGESLVEACDALSERVLDVAAGNGNASLAAARRGCQVTSTDYVEALLERVPSVRANRLDVQFQTADAENLPFDASFDVVLSTFGCMLRPTSQGGFGIGMSARRTHRRGQLDSGRFYRSGIPKHSATLPPPAGVQPPSRSSIVSHLEHAFGPSAVSIRATPMTFNFRYRSAAHFIDVFRTWYGPSARPLPLCRRTVRALWKVISPFC